jgi:hypothetical protein
MESRFHHTKKDPPKLTMDIEPKRTVVTVLHEMMVTSALYLPPLFIVQLCQLSTQT